ncbi:MAG: uracil-DNA glycosylase [Candidatus Pacebacteria bacterium]|nr:uracil-DNA glycosylase [Candidatus Paceibacterota bacterium]
MSEKEKKLIEIARRVSQCTNCPLHKTATNPVPGAGNPEAKIVFIGEAPGFHEDQQGLPFVGAAGKLLERLLALIDLKREEVFICNMLRHRPPGNRDPLPEEMKACQPFLDEQIKVIDPKILVTLGRFSMNKFLPGAYISQVHGVARYVNFAGKKRIVIPMYHPAAALRNGRVMTAFRNDFQRIPRFLFESLNQEETEEVVSEEKTQDEQMGLF